jgi:hypothetical protein
VQLDQARRADSLDAAVSPAERERLQAEQDEFFGAGLVGGGVSIGDKVKQGKDAPGRRTPDSGSTEQVPAGVAAEPSVAGIDIDIDLKGSRSGDVPGQPPTWEQQLEFFRERDYWIGDGGEVWHVSVTDQDQVVLARTGDADGHINAGAQFAAPRQVGSGALSGAVGTGSGSKGGSGSDGETVGLAESSDEVEQHAGQHDQCWLCGTAFDIDAQIDRIYDEQSFAIPVDKGGSGATDPLSTTPPASVAASGMVILYPDSRIVRSNELARTWDDGTAQTTIGRVSTGPLLEHLGRQDVTITRTTGPDGSGARIVDRESLGVYADPDFVSDLGSGTFSLPARDDTSVTITAPDGSIRSTSTRRPSPHPTPTTLDELRAVQEDLGLAYAAASGFDPSDSSSPFDQVMRMAQDAERRVDRDQLQRAALAGARHISGEGAEQVEAYAELEFEQVRERFAELGFDARRGNEEIDRRWFEETLFANAYYHPVFDEMVFGLMPDGEPLALSADVIAHEFTHRLIEHNGGITYQGQSGAINESLADTMAAAYDTEDWIIGEDVADGGVRDMSIPRTMDDFLETTADHGGVHTNSAIPNHAAYLIGEAVGRERMGEIYARTIIEHSTPDMTFNDLARATHAAAVDLYGRDSAEARAVRQAWDGVLLLDGDSALFETGGGSSGGGSSGRGSSGGGGSGGSGGGAGGGF